jgi:hypothetical protein
MSVPVVTGFSPQTVLSSGELGLDTTDGSKSDAIVTGSNLAAGNTVSVWNTATGMGSQPSWSGDLSFNGHQYMATLTCSNKTVKDDPMDTETVTVTVTNGDGTSDPFLDPNEVHEGPAS